MTDERKQVLKEELTTRLYETSVQITNTVEEKIDSELVEIREALEAHRPALLPTLDGLALRLKLAHHALGAASEAGEVAGKVKKLIRDEPLEPQVSSVVVDKVVAESGDTLWYLSALLRLLGSGLLSAMRDNVTKLKDRMDRGVLAGSGDER